MLCLSSGSDHNKEHEQSPKVNLHVQYEHGGDWQNIDGQRNGLTLKCSQSINCSGSFDLPLLKSRTTPTNFLPSRPF